MSGHFGSGIERALAHGLHAQRFSFISFLPQAEASTQRSVSEATPASTSLPHRD